MKKLFFAFIVFVSGASLQAQNADSAIVKESTTVSSGDLYEGLTRKITYNQMVSPYGIEVTFNKTVHLIFPTAVRYVDLGSSDIIAGKADGAENVIRIKSAVEGFSHETNFSVICEDGSFYSYNVKYADEPNLLNIEMKDFLQSNPENNSPNNQQEIYLKELGNESPLLVKLMMQSIYKENKRDIKHIASKRFGIEMALKGIYIFNDMLYFHTAVKNKSRISFETDFIRFKIVDKKVPKRTAIQETIIYPLRACNNVMTLEGKKETRTVYALKKFTIPDDKVLVIELFEKNGGRNQLLTVENTDIIAAGEINELKMK